MKKYYTIIVILAAINLLVTAAFISILPDQVPVHFGTNGEGNRIGSKYENLAFAAIAIGLAVLSIADSRTGERNNKKTVAYVGIAAQLLLIGTSAFIAQDQLATSAASASTLLGFDMSQFGAIAMGITLVVFGNLMPKTTINSTFGIRLPWTTKNDEAWQRSHRFWRLRHHTKRVDHGRMRHHVHRRTGVWCHDGNLHDMGAGLHRWLLRYQ